MGAWGTGLYSSDVAMDVRSTVSSVIRLPYDTQQLVDIIVEVFKDIAHKPNDEDYTIFWLSLADRLHSSGLEHKQITQKAIEIIDSNQDLKIAEELGMEAKDIKKRKKVLDVLKIKLLQPVQQKKRKTIKKPQPLIMNTGDVLIYPINERGDCFNPYFTHAKREMFPQNFKKVDWGAAVIIACGREFDFLTWYCPIVITERLNTDRKPTLEQLKDVKKWKLCNSGTCSKTHYQRMEIEKIGEIDIDPIRLEKSFTKITESLHSVVSDISIANSFGVKQCKSFNEPEIIGRLSAISPSDRFWKIFKS